jgi:hypothetical protein
MILETQACEILSKQDIFITIVGALIGSFITYFGLGVKSLFRRSQRYFRERIMMNHDLPQCLRVHPKMKKAMYYLSVVLVAVLIFEAYIVLFLAVIQWGLGRGWIF